MKKKIEMFIGGESRPIKFGINQQDYYCELRGGISVNKMNEEFATFATGDYQLSVIRDFFWSALKEGARYWDKSDFDYTNFDVGDWMEEADVDEISKAFKAYSDSLPKPKKK